MDIFTLTEDATIILEGKAHLVEAGKKLLFLKEGKKVSENVDVWLNEEDCILEKGDRVDVLMEDPCPECGHPNADIGFLRPYCPNRTCKFYDPRLVDNQPEHHEPIETGNEDFDEGYEEGYEEGYNEGYDEGYDEAYD